MKLQAAVGNDRLEIELKRDGRNVVALVDGRKYELEVSEPESDIYLLKQGARVFEAIVSRADKNSNFNVAVGNESIEVRLIDKKRLRSSTSDAGAAEGIAEIRSAMPGKIVRILVEAGESVEKGQGLIVV